MFSDGAVCWGKHHSELWSGAGATWRLLRLCWISKCRATQSQASTLSALREGVSRFVSEPEMCPRPTQCKIWQKVLMLSVCFIYFIAHYTTEVHTLEPILFYLFTISLHVLPKRTIHTINWYESYAL